MRKQWMRGLKSLTLIVLAVCMAVMAGACGKKDGGGSNNNDTDPSGSAKAPTITEFVIEADTGAVRGKVNEAHKLRYTIEGECTGQTVTVKKGGADATTGTDYEYVEQSKKITFKTAGLYTVTLKASNGEKSISKSVSLEITEIGAPVLTMPQESSAYVNEQTDFAYQVTYDAADAKATESVAVTYKADAQAAAQTVTDNAEYYTLLDGKFTPKKTGEYTVTVSVTSVKSLTAQGVWVLTSLEEGMVLITKTEDPDWRIEDGKILVETNTATEFAFDTKGYNADRFTVAKSLQKGENDKSDMVVLSAAADLLTVTAAEAGDYVLTVTFTSKSDNTKVSSATWNIRVRDDITPPEFGADPFDGTWDKLIPNVGMMLYFDATDDKATLTYRNVTYTIVNNDDGTATATGAAIVNSGVYANYPYLKATGIGKITVEMAVSDGANTVKAQKVFTVENAATDRAHDVYFANAYKGTHANAFNSDQGVWVGKADGTLGNPANVVATKDGVLYQHTGFDEIFSVWMEHQATGATRNFEIEFDFTPLELYATPGSGLGMRAFDGAELGCIGINWRNTAGDMFNGWADVGLNGAGQNAVTPSVLTKANTTYRFKLVKQDAKWAISINDTEYIVAGGTQNKNVGFVAMNCFDSGKVLIENITVVRS